MYIFMYATQKKKRTAARLGTETVCSLYPEVGPHTEAPFSIEPRAVPRERSFRDRDKHRKFTRRHIARPGMTNDISPYGQRICIRPAYMHTTSVYAYDVTYMLWRRYYVLCVYTGVSGACNRTFSRTLDTIYNNNNGLPFSGDVIN